MGTKKRIAFVNQRCGLEVNGGSEQYTLELARHLKDRYDIEIITTKVLDHTFWENYYEEDVEVIDDVVIIRFKVDKLRDFRLLGKYFHRAQTWNLLKDYYERKWLETMGPYCPKLVDYLKRNADDYDAIVFVTYLYYPAVWGIQAVPDKAIFLPTAHDESYIYLDLFRTEFETAQALIYLTPEERAFVESKFAVQGKPWCIAGSGVDLPPSIDNKAFREKFGVTGDYLVYVGRIETGKLCDRMIEMFRAYKDQHPDHDLKLVLMGRAAMDIPEADDIIPVGFVSEQDKYDGIAGAQALWLPSKFESLSIAVLEALSLGVPVLVNGECAVLEGHCKRSGAGWSYVGEDDALAKIAEITSLPNREEIAQKAKDYIDGSYTWDIVLDNVSGLIDQVIEKNASSGSAK